MEALTAYSTVALTLGVVAARPRIGRAIRVSPAAAALAGVGVMIALGVVRAHHLAEAARTLWRPVVAIVCIMATTASARRLGVLDAIAARTIGRVDGSAARVFGIVFALSAATSAVLNNDAAVLLLTPIVIASARARFFGRPRVAIAFAFAVFMAAGVAPLVVSNPMNMVVAAYANIGFNEYAARMIPIAIAGWVVAFVVLRVVFRRALAAGEARGAGPAAQVTPLAGPQRGLLVLLPVVVIGYAAGSSLGAPLWAVAAVGAAAALGIARAGGCSPVGIVVRDVSWDVVAFLGAVFVLALGLRNVGVVDHLAPLYARFGAVGVGVTSAAGSALLNNHPMAVLNVLALDATPGATKTDVLAALIGGDLGPRLLPMGSLAGLLWLESLRSASVDVPLRRFVGVGAAVTLPSLTVSLALLALTR